MWQELNLDAVRYKLTEARTAMDMMEMIFMLVPKTKLMVITCYGCGGARGTLRERRMLLPLCLTIFRQQKKHHRQQLRFREKGG